MTSYRNPNLEPKTPWTLDDIRGGLLLFYKEFGRYPTSIEIDKYAYLPNSRTIQRSFGGLVNIRKTLIPNEILDHTSGGYRRNTAREADDRAKIYEEEFYNFLTKHFISLAIHEHKTIRPGGINSDFFVYLNENDGIVIDLFYAKHMHSLMGVVNIKLKRYTNLPFEVYFTLVGNNEIKDSDISEYIARRKLPLPKNIHLVTERACSGKK